MSLYQVQKLLYQLNRDQELRRRFAAERDAVLTQFELTGEERAAIRHRDIGLLYVLGVNGQLLMHYAALCGFEWSAYLEAMREGVRRHGPVRAGVYALVADWRLALVFASACGHAPGIVGRAERADADARDAFYGAMDRLRQSIEATRPDALLVVAAEHFANFFMNNMPAFAIGMAEHYDGPATPNSGKINEAWDRDFLAHWSANDQAALTAYTDEETYHQGGQGGFEIRTFIAVAGAAEGSVGKMLFYRPIPIFAVGCTVAVMQLAGAASSRSWRAGLSARVAMPPPCSGSECCWLGCNACSPA